MSEELADEVEAINSIYGDGSLVRTGDGGAPDDADVYILTLPEREENDGGEAVVSLRLQFPPGYPDVPPSVVGTNSAAGGRRGVAARDLDLFRRALGDVYQPGQVCLFDAVEELRRLQDEAGLTNTLSSEGGGDGADEAHGGRGGDHDHDHVDDHDEDDDDLGPEPQWVLSDAAVELKSVFVARCATGLASPDQAARHVRHLLASDKRVRTATHNITAWRIRGPNGTSFQDCDDDGETAAGGRLLHLMQLMDLWDCMVVVTRWYGGQKLGPRRFALINTVARDAFLKAGLVEEAPTGGKKKGHGK